MIATVRLAMGAAPGHGHSMQDKAAIIVGESGAIGTALAEHYAQAGYATIHRLGRTAPIRCDYDNPDSVSAALAALSDLAGVDRVVIATGLLHDGARGPEKTMRAVTAAWLEQQLRVNFVGPALLLGALLPLLSRERAVRVGVLSARVGSISDNRLGGWYGYRASKAALNQFIKTAAIEWCRTHPMAALVALHPGTVRSPLSAPFTARRDADDLFDASDSAGRLAAVLDAVTPDQSGLIFDYAGREITP